MTDYLDTVIGGIRISFPILLPALTSLFILGLTAYITRNRPAPRHGRYRK